MSCIYFRIEFELLYFAIRFDYYNHITVMIQNQLAAPGEKDGDWTILASVIHSLCKSNFITMKL